MNDQYLANYANYATILAVIISLIALYHQIRKSEKKINVEIKNSELNIGKQIRKSEINIGNRIDKKEINIEDSETNIGDQKFFIGNIENSNVAFEFGNKQF